MAKVSKRVWDWSLIGISNGALIAGCGKKPSESTPMRSMAVPVVAVEARR